MSTRGRCPAGLKYFAERSEIWQRITGKSYKDGLTN